MTQPLACQATRLGIDGARHVYVCRTVLFIFPDRKPKAERLVECMETKLKITFNEPNGRSTAAIIPAGLVAELGWPK